MRAGAMRDRLVFQRRFEAARPTAQGKTQFEWQDLSASVSAAVTALKSGDQVIAGRIAGVTAYAIKIRARPDLKTLGAGDRAVDARDPQRIFRITSVLPGDRRDSLDIVAETGVAT